MLIMKVFVRKSNRVNDQINYVPQINRKYKECSIQAIFIMAGLIWATVVKAAPHAVNDNTTFSTLNHAVWPPMKHHDIWNDDKSFLNSNQDKTTLNDENDNENVLTDEMVYGNFDFSSQQFLNKFIENNATEILDRDLRRKSKVIHLFPVPVDGECLSDDGRRTGSCFNAYECRNKGGEAKGECALGFGVCCIFIANCNETISNNITYLVSPNFPSFMPNNVTNCSLKIKLMNDDVSQIRIDFYHFILGQPNRRSGVCDGDVFSVSGGPGGTISLCGQNSGQHIYYDVGGRMLPRQTLYGSLRPLRYEDLYPGRNNTNETRMEIDINLNFTSRFLPTRLWEIRISQIPFSQRAPAGCLQYFTGPEGVFQTFNFADNGRHLANQNYRICMRQEMDMCSIVYQPCDEQSFRIGPGVDAASLNMLNIQYPDINGVQSLNENDGIMNGLNGMQQMNPAQMQVLADDSANSQTGTVTTTTTMLPISSTIQQSVTTTTPATTTPTLVSSSVTDSTTTTIALSTASSLADDVAGSSSTNPPAAASSTASTSTVSTPLSDDTEGSGDDEDVDLRFRPTAAASVSRRPRPTRGGFDILGLLRSAFQFGFRSSRQLHPLTERQMRQFYSSCRDRITMPCIIEDFIGTGLGPLPGCEPVHCGMQFCSSGVWPCRIESTVTPFYVGIHFGDGNGKGSPEDNIGACLRYQQVQCM